MIISHRYQFIFLKTAKTAGTSMEIALSEFCGPDDIITPILPADEAIRRDLGYPGPQNYLAPLSRYNLVDLKKLLLDKEKKRLYYHHISAREVRKTIGRNVWNSYFKFCFERNPWDRMISMYYWRYPEEPRPTFMEFIHSRHPKLLRRRGYQLYTIRGKLAVDKVYRYEYLEEAVNEIAERLNLPKVPVLPRTKANYRVDKRPYRESLSDEERDFIAKLFEKEIALYGYEF